MSARPLDDVLAELRSWLTANWDPGIALREWWRLLGEAGWAAPSWPEAWFGKGLPAADGGLVARAIVEFGAVPGPGSFGVGMAGPTMLAHGTEDQWRRHLHSIVIGAEHWCQLFSEPGAGSDLAGLTTRAVRDGDEWVVDGQKVWTSEGLHAKKAMLLARTNPDVPKHAGISYFLLDLDQPGVEMRPLREMTGRAYFNEVFLTGARVADADLVGGEGNGWTVANTTLAFERAGSGQGGTFASPARAGEIAGDLDRPAGDFAGQVVTDGAESASGTRAAKLIALARRLGRADEPAIRQGLTRLLIMEDVGAYTRLRARALQSAGRELAGSPNLSKMAENHRLRLGQQLTMSLLGSMGTLYGYEPEPVVEIEAATGMDDLQELVEWSLFAAAPQIYGGSDQIQRNIVGERVLGLPREPGPPRDTPFRDLPRNG